MPVSRRMRTRVKELLSSQDWGAARRELTALPPMRLANVLFAYILSGDPRIKWRAVQAMGDTVARLAEEDMESARTIMRRFIWSLNDESGGIGWGASECIGEVCAVHPALAGEFGHILVSFICEHGYHLEFEPLLRGALWGICRAAGAGVTQVADAAQYIAAYLESDDAEVRALAARASGLLFALNTIPLIKSLLSDHEPVSFYENDEIITRTVADEAAAALRVLSNETAPHLRAACS